jgi:hypothetical protein
MLAARALVAPALPPRACSTQRLRRGTPRCHRQEQRRGGSARASLMESAVTFAEASAGVVALQLVGRAMGAGGKKAATSAGEQQRAVVVCFLLKRPHPRSCLGAQRRGSGT